MTSPLARVGVNSGALVQSSTSIFDTVRGAGSYTFRFDLVDAASNKFVRTLTPYADTVPSLRHDTTAAIKRQLSLTLGPADTAVVDTIRHRVRPSLVTLDGSQYPLGRYMFSTNLRAVTSAGRLGQPALMDEAFIMDQPREGAFPPAIFTSARQVTDLLHELMLNFPTIDYRFESSVFDTANTWSFGTTSWQILSDLGNLGGYFAPWMDNRGRARLVQAFDPATVVPLMDWDRYPHVYSDGVTEEDDLLTAPNRFIVVSNAPGSATATGPLIGSYDVPTSAPISIQNRGFVLPNIQQLQLQNQAQAQAIAQATGLRSTIYERVTLDTFPDPRHDSYDVIRWQGENWLELSWSMDMIAGGNMSHTLRKAYAS